MHLQTECLPEMGHPRQKRGLAAGRLEGYDQAWVQQGRPQLHAPQRPQSDPTLEPWHWMCHLLGHTQVVQDAVVLGPVPLVGASRFSSCCCYCSHCQRCRALTHSYPPLRRNHQRRRRLGGSVQGVAVGRAARLQRACCCFRVFAEAAARAQRPCSAAAFETQADTATAWPDVALLRGHGLRHRQHLPFEHAYGTTRQERGAAGDLGVRCPRWHEALGLLVGPAAAAALASGTAGCCVYARLARCQNCCMKEGVKADRAARCLV
eukprot:1150497-Pelagomonas_calceolata.AAC.7